MRKVGRVIECAGLEIRYTLSGYRGFESLTFRLEDKRKPLVRLPFLFFHCRQVSIMILSRFVGSLDKSRGLFRS